MKFGKDSDIFLILPITPTQKEAVKVKWQFWHKLSVFSSVKHNLLLNVLPTDYVWLLTYVFFRHDSQIINYIFNATNFWISQSAMHFQIYVHYFKCT